MFDHHTSSKELIDIVEHVISIPNCIVINQKCKEILLIMENFKCWVFKSGNMFDMTESRPKMETTHAFENQTGRKLGILGAFIYSFKNARGSSKRILSSPTQAIIQMDGNKKLKPFLKTSRANWRSNGLNFLMATTQSRSQSLMKLQKGQEKPKTKTFFQILSKNYKNNFVYLEKYTPDDSEYMDTLLEQIVWKRQKYPKKAKILHGAFVEQRREPSPRNTGFWSGQNFHIHFSGNYSYTTPQSQIDIKGNEKNHFDERDPNSYNSINALNSLDQARGIDFSAKYQQMQKNKKNQNISDNELNQNLVMNRNISNLNTNSIGEFSSLEFDPRFRDLIKIPTTTSKSQQNIVYHSLNDLQQAPLTQKDVVAMINTIMSILQAIKQREITKTFENFHETQPI
ncbi:hypothetical protein M0811_07928 [Anaeramoeba ignava]|uniref:Uncharacterized protein n=1 Tax=Anaeramoeba ignava TaxID=1746090 RepID=A0A9Q0LPH3_ANAIG|nr:hypothetical protein M0811_07928 [Anaeramoeba ignava]